MFDDEHSCSVRNHSCQHSPSHAMVASYLRFADTVYAPTQQQFSIQLLNLPSYRLTPCRRSCIRSSEGGTSPPMLFLSVTAQRVNLYPWSSLIRTYMDVSSIQLYNVYMSIRNLCYTYGLMSSSYLLFRRFNQNILNDPRRNTKPPTESKDTTPLFIW